ncbi:ABC transporter ATP-binding protein [Sulfitobacter sp. F26169L]|uniref:ABC transporter ATP-binding protein n=1 Tax=Sulfitobacter sp. F26169L TaxID=2996015 RepID=UPI002260D312|nr:ABC transporter ATP-binding protein [Sulfitobacter sp. F26169L]MCX7567417.1 ABC transporter ATP-binding protein [Sulfitobacter sp. F26169L]
MTLLTLSDFSVTRRKRDILHNVNLRVDTGELVGIIGPNGAGKTTLMRAALGLIDAVGQSSLTALSARERGRAVAWMPQSREIAWPVDVQTLVMLGRTPHLATGQRATDADSAAVDRALLRMDLTSLRNRTVTRLSGGEQARVLIARALAQETPLLMADEPIAGLDPAHQIATMQTFCSLAAEGRSVIVSLHDLGLAARHCTRLVVIDRCGIVADGTPSDVLTPELVRDTFGINAFLQNTADGLIFQPLAVV